MSKVHSSCDYPTTTSFDHHYVYRKPAYESVSRGRGRGGRGGGGRGGGARGENCCFGCGLPGHIVRECPFFANSLRNYGSRSQDSINDLSENDSVESTSGTLKGRSKPLNTSPAISTSSDPAKPFCNDLLSKNADMVSIQAKIKLKERELELHAQEIDTLKGQLSKVTSELESSQAKNEEMIQNMDGLQKDLERCRNELSYEIKKNKEMTTKWFSLNNEFEETRDKLNEKIKKLEKVNLTAHAEKTKLKLETDQWKKVGKAVASVLVEHADICSKIPELESVVLYYSNRAAKRMSLGKIRKAIDDCRMATRLEPGFIKVYLTAGNCHMLLGEIDNALNYYKKCLDSRTVCLDRRLIIEASHGLQKAENVVNYIDQSAELLQSKTLESATNALEVLTEALSISCYSEKLLEMKGEALFMLHKYGEVAQMCEQTLVFAEKNCITIADCNQVSDVVQKQPLKLWRWSLMSRSYFHMAKFDLALAILEKYEQRVPSETKTEGLSFPSATTMCELLRYKSAGNEAFEGGKYREAVEHYSNAIVQSIESRSFTAICLCNRAAAHQALGEIIDAIADCNLAIALDGDYAKAISRRANLHEKIKDYVHAALDFERLVSLLEKHSEKKYMEDLKVARQHLSFVKRKMKQGMTMDFYLILGLEESATGLEIKKAYRKAALRHHPDKAGKFLARRESGADGDVWKEIFTTIHKDADKLFKIIGEAYAVLSDSDKRFKYNLEDAMNDGFRW